jgi:hypothetical protein
VTAADPAAPPEPEPEPEAGVAKAAQGSETELDVPRLCQRGTRLGKGMRLLCSHVPVVRQVSEGVFGVAACEAEVEAADAAVAGGVVVDGGRAQASWGAGGGAGGAEGVPRGLWEGVGLLVGWVLCDGDGEGEFVVLGKDE